MEEKQVRNNSKRIYITAVLILLLMVTVTGATYAYFAISATNDNVITGTTAKAELSLTVTEAPLGGNNSGATKTGVMVPQLYSALGTAIGNNYKCVDANGNVVCKVYTITVQNKSTAAIKLNGTIQFTQFNGNGATNLRWRRIESTTTLSSSTSDAYVARGVQAVVNSSETVARFDLTKATAVTNQPSTGVVCVPTNSSYRDDSHCTDINLKAYQTSGDTATYYIVIWLEEMNVDQPGDQLKTFKATIKFEGENGTGITSTITA